MLGSSQFEFQIEGAELTFGRSSDFDKPEKHSEIP